MQGPSRKDSTSVLVAAEALEQQAAGLYAQAEELLIQADRMSEQARNLRDAEGMTRLGEQTVAIQCFGWTPAP